MASLLDIGKNIYGNVQKTVNPILQRISQADLNPISPGAQSINTWSQKPSNQLVKKAINYQPTFIKPISQPSYQSLNPQVSNPFMNIVNAGRMQVGANVRSLVNQTAANQSRLKYEAMKQPGLAGKTAIGMEQLSAFPRRLFTGTSPSKFTPEEKKQLSMAATNIGGLSGGIGFSKNTMGMNKQQLSYFKSLPTEARNIIGKFAEEVEKNPGGINRKNLGWLGDYIQTVLEESYGTKASNLTNRQVKNLLDLSLQTADNYKGRVSVFSGLSVNDVRKAQPKGVGVGEGWVKARAAVSNDWQLAEKQSRGVGEMGATNSQILSPTTPKTGKIKVTAQSKLLQPADQLVSGNVKPGVKTQIVPPQPQVRSSNPSLPQRGFAESVQTNKKTPQELAPELEKIRYNPLSNKETLNFADKMIKKSGAEALSYATNSTDTNANAVALRLIEKYIDKGRYQEAIDLTKSVSPRFTKAGQEIQILSAYGRLTPTGAIKYAQRLINEANKANPRLKLELTPENTKTITEAAKKIQKLPDGSRERTVAIAQLMQEVTDIVPPSIGQKIATIQTMAQLLNPKTAIRNIVGNTIFTGMENVSDVVGTGLDKATSLVTGQRTKVLPSLKSQKLGFMRGAKEGLEDVRLGVNTSPGNTKFDLTGKTFTGGLLGKAEKALNVELRVPDRAAYTAAYEGSLNNQMRAAGVTKATDQMQEIAHADGLYRTFQDNSKLAQMFAGIKKIFNKVGTPDGKFGLGDFVLKYPKTPANILARGLDYSPVGYVKGIYEAARPIISGQAFNQKSFVESLSRATVGSGLIATGYLLAKNGIITGKQEKDYDINAVQKTTGQGAFKINVDALKRYWLSGGQKQDAQNGDTLVSYDWAQPTSLSLAMGANQALGGKATEGINAAVESYQSAVDTITGQPMVRGLMDFASGIKNKGIVGAGTDAVLGSVSGFVPSIIRQISNIYDTTQRSTYNPDKIKETVNKVYANIPGLRNTLEPKIDVFGNQMPNYEGSGLRRLFDIFINPAFVTQVKENPAAKEVLDIYQRSGETQQAPRIVPEKVKINGETIATTPEQYRQYQEYVGQKTNELFNLIITDPTFQSATDEDKAKFLANTLTDINSAAKIELFGNQPKTTSTDTKNILKGSPVKGITVTKEGNLTFAPEKTAKTTTKKAKAAKKVTITKAKTAKIKIKKFALKAKKLPKLKLAKSKKLKTLASTTKKEKTYKFSAKAPIKIARA